MCLVRPARRGDTRHNDPGVGCAVAGRLRLRAAERAADTSEMRDLSIRYKVSHAFVVVRFSNVHRSPSL